MVNPQYHLRVHNTSTSIDKRSSTSTCVGRRNKTQVILTTRSTRDISLNVTAVGSQGERISELSQKEVVAHSGPHTYGHARIAAYLARTSTFYLEGNAAYFLHLANSSCKAGDYTVILLAYGPDQMGNSRNQNVLT
ncbi:uncharacterized protein F5147DRAFT_69851 [Suillus discolor]|uniref:Uncharacterized protein n=1 Tax=Suillus discolor TaxID=1912936 RepID=A0A9P7ES22_9AGAM|nr:uncharacterized protein F5147DRAFT_69851 [Suillus discolor]KAG2087029.1 hypothetical protein F5147DRAFT_69851 [Suillus discolor]